MAQLYLYYKEAELTGWMEAELEPELSQKQWGQRWRELGAAESERQRRRKEQQREQSVAAGSSGGGSGGGWNSSRNSSGGGSREQRWQQSVDEAWQLGRHLWEHTDEDKGKVQEAD